MSAPDAVLAERVARLEALAAELARRIEVLDREQEHHERDLGTLFAEREGVCRV